MSDVETFLDAWIKYQGLERTAGGIIVARPFKRRRRWWRR